MIQSKLMPAEVVTEVLAFLPYQNARQLLPISRRYSQILARQIDSQLHPIFETICILSVSNSQLEDQIKDTNARIDALCYEALYKCFQLLWKLFKFLVSRGIFLAIFKHSRYSEEVTAIREPFIDRFEQISHDLDVLEQILSKSQSDKLKNTQELNKWQHYIQYGEIPIEK